MTAGAFDLVVDRAFEEAFLNGGLLNLDGDQSNTFSLPTGFGDCALLEVYVNVVSIATMMTSPELSGPRCVIVTPAGAVQDLPFDGKWIRGIAGELHCRLGPDQVQFWREHELLSVAFGEVDTNATPTADLAMNVKVRRLRPALSRTPEELHFFLTS